jgi:hypothetical protein
VPFGMLFAYAYFEWLFPTAGKPYGDPHTWQYVLIATALAGVWAFFAVKSLFVGIWLLEDSVVVRSWFRTWRLPREQGAVCHTVGYDGFLIGNGTSWYWSMLELTDVDGKVWAVRATIAHRKKSLALAAKVNVWLGAPIATPPGMPPRHLRVPGDALPNAE